MYANKLFKFFFSIKMSSILTNNYPHHSTPTDAALNTLSNCCQNHAILLWTTNPTLQALDWNTTFIHLTPNRKNPKPPKTGTTHDPASSRANYSFDIVIVCTFHYFETLWMCVCTGVWVYEECLNTFFHSRGQGEQSKYSVYCMQQSYYRWCHSSFLVCFNINFDVIEGVYFVILFESEEWFSRLVSHGE